MPSDRTRQVRASVVAGRRAATEATRSGEVSEVLVASTARATAGLRAVLSAAEAGSIPVRRVTVEELDALAEDHRGVVAILASVPEPHRPLRERDLATFRFEPDALVVVLDGITDPQNLGAAARSAEAAGAAMLVSRIRRAAEVSPAAIGASAGALLHLPHARVANIPRAIERLQAAGFFVVGLDGDAQATVFDDACPPGRVAIAVGSEGAGLSRLAKERCDALRRLPMKGRVASMNASAALAAALYAYVLPSRA